MSDEETNVVLTANTAPYERSVDSATAATNRMIDAVGKLSIGIDNAFRSAGKSIQLGGAGLTASIVAAGYAAGRLDQQMSQLQASFTMATKGQEAYEIRLASATKAVTNLRKEFGSTSAEAIGLVTTLNKMGQGARDIDRLSQSFMKLGAVSGDNVQGLVTGMISLQRAMGTEGTRQTEVFNAALAQVSQTAGVSAAQVMQFSAAIAPVAKVSGMSTKEVMGVSTAFVKAGADGYQAANAFNKMLTDITRSIQYGSPELKAYSNLIGVSVDQFKQMNRTEVITQVFEAINKQGPAAIKTLERFGLDGVRTYKSLQAVASQGGLRGAIADSMGLGAEGKMNTASERAFDGLNDQLKKMAENGKMIAEAFGKGVLPVMEGLAKVINSVLAPVTSLLQSLGKLPGGAAVTAGVGAMVAGSVVKHFTGLSALGAGLGAARTIRGGWRAGARDYADLSESEQRAFQSHQAWRRGEPTEGNWMQHTIYGWNQRLGYNARLANQGRSPGTLREDIQDRFSRTARGAIGYVGSFFRAPLDSLSLNATRNNFNRDQNIQAFTQSQIPMALRWMHPDSPTNKGIRDFGKGINTSIDSTKKYDTVLKAATGETLKFSKSLGEAAIGAAYAGTKAAGYVAPRTIRGVAGAIGGGLQTGALKAMDWVGGPPMLAMAGAGYLFNQYQNNRQRWDEAFKQADNTSPFSTYAANLGEASAATKSFTDVLKTQATKIAETEWSPKVTQAQAAAAARDKSGLVYSGLSGTTQEQATSIAAAVFARNPSNAVKESLKGDLLKTFYSPATVEQILTDAQKQSSRLDMTGLFESATDKNRSMKSTFLGISDPEAMKQAMSIGAVIKEGYANDTPEQASRRTIATLNQMVRTVSRAGPLDKAGRDTAAAAWISSVTGTEATAADIDAVSAALGDTSGRSGEDRYRMVQDILMKGDSAIGRSLKGAMMTTGAGSTGTPWRWDMRNRTSLEMPVTSRYGDRWSNLAGGPVDPYVLQQMRGYTATEDEGLFKKGQFIGPQGGELGRYIFGVGGPNNSALSRSVFSALSNQEDANAQWAAMKEMADSAKAIGGSFTGATVELDKLKVAAGDSTSALYQMANSAQEYLRVRQTEAMAYMSTPQRISQLQQNFQASQQSFIDNPNKESGQNLERDRAALEGARADVYNRLKGFMTQVREFNVSQARAAEDYKRTVQYNNEDFVRQQKYALEDYNKSRKYSQEDFQISRLRAEEDFQHQVVVLTRNAAKQIMNIYERINVQRTWSASNLLENMRDQQRRLAEQQENLGTLRKAGLSSDAISILGLNDPNNAQQLARLTDEMLNDPAMIKAYNKAIQDRMKSAGKVVTDKDSDQWKEMLYSFNLNMKRGQEEYEKGMARQEEQFALSQERQRIQFGISMDRMEEQYQLGMGRAAEDLNRSMLEITGTFTELAQDAVSTLTGAAQDQMLATLKALGYTRDQIKLIVQGVYDDIEKIFDKLGVAENGTPTMNGKKMMTGTIKLPGGGRINAGQFAQGGEIQGRSAHNQADNIPIWATAGEYMQPVDAVNYYGKEAMEAIQKRRIPKGLLQGFATGGQVYKAMEGWVAKNIPNIGVTSDYRPGAITATGYVSQHALGRAIDLAPPSMDAFNKIKNTFNKSILELIYSPAGYQQMYMGKNKYYGEPTRGDHWNHIHWAMQTFGKGMQAAFPELGYVWDGTLDSIVDLVKKAKNIKKLDDILTNAPVKQLRRYGSGFTQQSALIGALGRLDVDRIDDDYKSIKKIDWKGDGAIFDKASVIGVGERGPEAVLPLDSRGADFMFELMKRNASDSKRAMLAASGLPQRASTISYYQRVDKSTTISGPITVQAQDPDEMLRKIEAKKRLEALKGRK